MIAYNHKINFLGFLASFDKIKSTITVDLSPHSPSRLFRVIINHQCHHLKKQGRSIACPWLQMSWKPDLANSTPAWQPWMSPILFRFKTVQVLEHRTIQTLPTTLQVYECIRVTRVQPNRTQQNSTRNSPAYYVSARVLTLRRCLIVSRWALLSSSLFFVKHWSLYWNLEYQILSNHHNRTNNTN